MTGPELAAAIPELGFRSPYTFAKRCRVDASTVYKWMKPDATVPGYAETIVELLRERKPEKSDG